MSRPGTVVLLFPFVTILPIQAQSPTRFSAEAIDLLEQTTQSYDLNGRRVSAGKFDEAVLARLLNAKDPRVRELARMMPELKLLQALSKQQGGAAGRAIVDQANRLPQSIAQRVISAMASPDEEKDDLRSAAKTLEAIMGSRPQEEVNKAWALNCLGNGLGMALKQQLSELANAGPAGPSGPLNIDVTIGNDPAKAGAITVVNRSGKALHHCLIITRLEADRERIREMAEQEDTVGALLLPALGFSRETVSGSREAARLRYIFFEQDKGVVVYLPEMPAGASVTTSLAAPAYYAVAKNAEVSLWADEGAAEHRTASNWAAVRKTNAPPVRGRPNVPGRSAMTTKGARPQPKSAIPPTKLGPFDVGSVWRGESRVGPTDGKKTTQQIELSITRRDGETFEGRILYNGRNPAQIEGTITGDKVEWQIRVKGTLGLPHLGQVKGQRMEVAYSGPGSGDTTVEGTMVLNRVTDRRR
mgnify:CR=1 FL=1